MDGNLIIMVVSAVLLSIGAIGLTIVSYRDAIKHFRGGKK